MRFNAANDWQTTINMVGGLGSGDTTVTVTDATGHPVPPFKASVGDEIMNVTAVSTNDLTVQRGQEGTSPASHDNGARVENRFTAEVQNELWDEVEGHIAEDDTDDVHGYKTYVDGMVRGFKNILINGDFRINQRNFDGNWTGISNGDYGYDRWKRHDANNITQVIEAGNFKPSTTYTISGTNVTTAQLTSPASGHWTITVSNTANNIQLEEGVVATPFEHRPIGLELSLCQRYFWAGRQDGGGYAFLYMGKARTLTFVGGATFPVTMRTNPTITVSGGTYVNCTHHDTQSNQHGFCERVTIDEATDFRAYSQSYSVDAEL